MKWANARRCSAGRKNGRQGIREVIAWAKADPGRYDPNQLDLLDDGTGPSETDTGCDDGFCALS